MAGTELIHLYVEICSDGSLLAYDKNHSIHPTYTSILSYSTLHKIYEMTQLSSENRRGLGDKNIKYVKYYFKNTRTGDVVEIPSEHIPAMLRSIKKGG